MRCSAVCILVVLCAPAFSLHHHTSRAALAKKKHIPGPATVSHALTTALRTSISIGQGEMIMSGRRLTTLLGLSYFATIVSVMTLPCCLSHVDQTLFSAGKLSSLIFAATCGTVAGKFLLGVPTDKIGGQSALKLCLFSNIVLLYGIGASQSRWVFSTLWVLVSFIYGSAWGAVGNVVRQSFEKTAWGEQLGLVAAFSRVGSFSSSFFFGWLMQRYSASMGKESWRLVFKYAAGLQAIILAIYVLCGAAPANVNIEPEEAAVSNESAPQLLKRVSKDSMFWAMAVGKAVLLGVGQQIGFFPLFLVTGLGFSTAAASSASGLFAVGSLFSSLLGARLYKTLTPKQQISTVVAMNICATVFPAILALNAIKWIPPMTNALVLSVLTLWGVCWALPFYIPPGIIALKVGGKNHAALITNLYDAGGFAIAAIYSIFAMELGRVGEWFPIMVTLSTFGLLSTLSMHHAMERDASSKK